jgi:GR25 family glycosyltransferase involved in LPS biosynthesis
MIGIVAHTKRANQTHILMDQVQAAYTNIDDGTLGCDDNHRHVWQWLLQHTTNEWCIVLEDDALPVEGFIAQAEQALSVAPSPVISFYLGRHHIPELEWEQRKQQAIARADQADAHFITSNHLLHAVAVAVRTDHIAPMLRHLNTLPILPIDEAITHWIQNTGQDVSYTWPSLADHADQPTLFRHRDKLPRPPGRIAYRTGGHNTWTDRAVTM